MNEQEKEPELTFPLTHDKCPACGSTRRVANEVKKQEEAKGKVRPNANVQFVLGMYQAGISDPGIATLSCPIILSLVDVCVDCGCFWSPMTNCQEQMMQSVVPPQKPKQRPGLFFGKG